MKKHGNASPLGKIVQQTVQNGDTTYQSGKPTNDEEYQDTDELERVEKEMYRGWSL